MSSAAPPPAPPLPPAKKARRARPLESGAVVLPALPALPAPTAISLLEGLSLALTPRLDLTGYVRSLPGSASIAQTAAEQIAVEPPGFAVPGVSTAILEQLAASERWFVSADEAFANVTSTIFQARRAIDHHVMRSLRKVAHAVVDEKDPALAARWRFLIDSLAASSPPTKAQRAHAAALARAASEKAAAGEATSAEAPPTVARRKRARAPLTPSAVPMPMPPANVPPPTAASIAALLGVVLTPKIETARFTKQVPGHTALLAMVVTHLQAEQSDFAVNQVTPESLTDLDALALWFSAAESAMSEASRTVAQHLAAVEHHLVRRLRKIARTVHDENDAALSGRWAFLTSYLAKFAGGRPRKQPAKAT